MLNRIASILRGLFAKAEKPGRRVVSDEEFNEARKAMEDEANRILDKVSKRGAGSLSEKEKKFLDKWTKK